jgi:two-component system OmpR family response regulator
LGYDRHTLADSQVACVRDRIMIVGRDVGLRAQLARLLKAGGYRVEIAESASHASRIGFAGIALAIVAPDGRGPAERGVIQELRAAVGSVLLVAAPNSKRDPYFDLLDVTDETGLLARVTEVLAPAPDSDAVEPMLEFAGYHLDLAGHSLLDPKGNEVPLTHGEFGLLRVFAQRAGRVLSREQLLQLLAGRDAESYDRSIDMQIVRLRRKIEPDPKRPTLIVTIPNSGYKFAVKVWHAETATLQEQEPTAAPPKTTPAVAERRYVTALAAELLPADGSSLPEDPEELRAVISTYRRYAAAVIARHGGVMAESRVREVLAYFGHPVAQEHAAERALYAASALAEHLPEGFPPGSPYGSA